jgi:hypothetical protein
MPTQNIAVLNGAYLGKTGAIVGGGPSIIKLTREDFDSVDVVLVIDFAIAKIRTLSLSIPIYSMWKDRGTLKGTVDGGINPCPGMPPCTNKCSKLVPQSPERYIVHEHESKYCNDLYSPRYIFNNNQFGHHWGRPSVVPSIEIMMLFGIADLKMMGFDSMYGNTQTCQDGTTVLSLSDGSGYLTHPAIIKEVLSTCNFNSVEFIR